MTKTVVKLPFPVSTNALYTNVPGRGRVKSARHATWKQVAGIELAQQRLKPVKGVVHLDIALGRPKNRDGTPSKVRRDLSNLVKCVEDILVEHGTIEDDCLVHDLHVYWCEKTGGAAVTIISKP